MYWLITSRWAVGRVTSGTCHPAVLKHVTAVIWVVVTPAYQPPRITELVAQYI